MTTEAQRLADILQDPLHSIAADYEAAALLRRLHEANAELLEALQEIEWSNEERWRTDRARAAIAKATGEQT